MKHLPEVLQEAGLAAGCGLTPDQCSRLVAHLELLQRWNRKLNLVGPGTLATWAERHTADSLAVARWVGPSASVVDVGSGAGFPAIPLAVVHGAARVTALEPRQNRSAFLQTAAAALQLGNLKVVSRRAEQVAETFDLVLGRAVAPPAEFARTAAALCSPTGRFAIFLQGASAPVLEAASLVESVNYGIPGQAIRTVALYVPRGTEGLS